MSNEYRIIPSFIQELLEYDIPVSLTKDSFIVDGFYKSGNVEVHCQGENNWFAKARYNEITDVEDLQDLVALNYRWWQRSHYRSYSWSQPDSRWIKLLIEYEYVTAKVIPEQIVYE